MRITGFVHQTLIKFSKYHTRRKLYEMLNESIVSCCTKDSKIINIGSGGAIKQILAKQGLSFKEIDIDPSRKPDFVCDIENMSIFKNNSIDIIFCIEVLEHVKNPFKAISEIKRVLKPNGLVIGSTPFIFPIHDEPFDFFRYTKYGLLHLFSDFQPVTLKERGGYVESAYIIMLRLINIGSNHEIFLGALIFPFMMVLYPFMFLANFVISNHRATAGYFFVFKKLK